MHREFKFIPYICPLIWIHGPSGIISQTTALQVIRLWVRIWHKNTGRLFLTRFVSFPVNDRWFSTLQVILFSILNNFPIQISKTELFLYTSFVLSHKCTMQKVNMCWSLWQSLGMIFIFTDLWVKIPGSSCSVKAPIFEVSSDLLSLLGLSVPYPTWFTCSLPSLWKH